MLHLNDVDLALAAIALVAALVNGGLGYGFSSITVPVAILFVSNKVLSPALVLVEVFINVVALAVNARGLPAIGRRVLPLLLGVAPGVAAGTWLLAEASNTTLRVATYGALLPLILLQSAGVRWPIRRESAAGPPVGLGLGMLYAATTISGPPLALLLNNQGFGKDEFRAALSLFRIIESVFTAALFASLGMFKPESLHVSAVVAPSILVGVPAGYLLLSRLPNETFRRICMSADALLVSFGLARVLAEKHLIVPALGYALMASVMTVDAYLLYRFFRVHGGHFLPPAPRPAAAEGRS